MTLPGSLPGLRSIHPVHPIGRPPSQPRRRWICTAWLAATLLAAAWAGSAPTALAAPAPSKLDRSQAGFYRFKVGAIDVTALSDGTVPLDVKVLTHVDPAARDALLAQAFIASPVDASVNAFLISIGDHRILIDAGSGELYGPTLNKLPAVLRAIGTPPEQITDILLTHIHTDHSGGLMDGSRQVFPNAIVHVDKRELAYWMNPANADRAPAMHKPLFQEAKLKIGPYVAAGKVQTFDGATPLFPGLRSLPTPGHTPGHTFYVLESQGEKLVFWGDILHIAAVQLPDPAVTIEFDSDPRAAAAQRARAFADAAQRGYLVAPAHMAFPGVGHLRSDPGRPGYVWVPIAYINDAIETSR